MNGYQKYKAQSIYSMSPSELLLMLYEEAIKRMKKAQYALEDHDYGVFEDCITRTVKIIRYLNVILDMEQPISQDFRHIYEHLFYNLSLIRAGRDRRTEEIEEVIHILTEFREGFEEAGRQVGDMHVTSEKSVVG
ncbi:MAG: flagellar export chaperone FliS [Lachnospiraceae bacterium]|nr:flagellar export chaperone FliS [Lachnospiraceae bacterium]